MSRLNRRKFLQTSAAASTAFGLFTIAGTKASGQVLGANDTVRVGVAGIRGRGADRTSMPLPRNSRTRTRRSRT